MQATIVFQKTWDAINALDENGERKYKYIIHEGSSRSSKTYSILQLFYLYALQNGSKRMSVWRDTERDCKDTIFHDMERAYPTFPGYSTVKLNVAPKTVYRFNNKTKIEIKGTDDDEKVMGYQGDVIWINEPYKISKETFDQLDMRTSDFVLIDWNPKKEHWIDQLKKDPRAITIQSTFKDNPFCPPEQRLKILSYQSVKMCDVVVSGLLTEQKARDYDMINNPLLLTEKQIAELSRCKENENKQSANDFNWSVYGLGLKAERPNRIFKWNPIPYSEYEKIQETKYYGVDWGKVDPWGIVEVKYYDGALYLHQINYLSENKIREKLTSTELAQISDAEEGFITWYFNRFGISKDALIICDNNKESKIRGLRSLGYHAFAAIKPKGSIVDGIDLLDAMPVYFTECSTDLKYEQENYSRKVDKYGVVEEEPEDLNNHLIDPTRYVASFLRARGIIRIAA